MQKAEEKEIPEDSVEECAITCSNTYGPSESNQPHKNSKVTFKEDQMDLTLLIDRESSPDVWQDALNLVAGSLYFPCVSYLCLDYGRSIVRTGYIRTYWFTQQLGWS